MGSNNDTTYNGWTNYATWRINLEVFYGFDTDGDEWDADQCENYVDELLSLEADGNTLALDYARAFVSDVNWHEIAEALNERNEE